LKYDDTQTLAVKDNLKQDKHDMNSRENVDNKKQRQEKAQRRD